MRILKMMPAPVNTKTQKSKESYRTLDRKNKAHEYNSLGRASSPEKTELNVI